MDGVFDLNRCRLIFKVDGRERLARDFSRQDGRAYHDVIEQDWQAGEHQLAFELQPLTPAEKQVRSLTIRIKSVTIRGPLEEKYWVRPKDYTRFFPKDVPRAPRVAASMPVSCSNASPPGRFGGRWPAKPSIGW